MATDFSAFARRESEEDYALDLQVKGIHCATCVLKVRETLTQNGAEEAFVDLSTGHVSLRWKGTAEQADVFAQKITAAGYDPSPFLPLESAQEDTGAKLLARCTILAGAASFLTMVLGLFEPPPVWAMIGLSLFTLFYSGRPFLFSALRALRHGNINMDVPISFALFLTAGLSVFEVLLHNRYAYFDSVVMLLFILLIGRYLDHQTRGKAKSAATELLALFAGTATLIEDETTRTLPVRDLQPDMILLVAVGERIAVDGEVTQGASDVDASIITGETQPQVVSPGSEVFGGTINLTAPLHVRVSAPAGGSLVAEVVKLMQKAQQGHARFVRLADRIAKLYTPAVFGLFVLTFLLWRYGFGLSGEEALLIASTVLIITCPCAMGLAVPAVQILASSRLFKKGLLVKSADALERLAKVDTIVFDKTGTLTMGQPKLVNRADITTEEIKLAASLAIQSRHPLARAVMAAHGPGPVYALDITETPGQGLETRMNGEVLRLGSRAWCGPNSFPADNKMELWLRLGYKPPRRLAFADVLRPDALALANQLRKDKYALYLLSGDREPVVAEVAQILGLDQSHAQMSPTDKCVFIESLKNQGRCVLMVGDGLNDAAALATADVSLSPSTALDLTQNAADIVFQGTLLAPVLEALHVARKAERLVKQNIGLSLLYNALAVPFAVAGQASPLLAAAAMSISSLTVVLNAQRMRPPRKSNDA